MSIGTLAGNCRVDVFTGDSVQNRSIHVYGPSGTRRKTSRGNGATINQGIVTAECDIFAIDNRHMRAIQWRRSSFVRLTIMDKLGLESIEMSDRRD